MSDGLRFSIDVSKVQKHFSQYNFNRADMKKALKAGLRKSANIVRKAAQSNLMQVSSKFAPLKMDVNLKVYKSGLGASVNILNGKNKTIKIGGVKGKRVSGSYILRFFETGTTTRYTKKGANRGSIAATHFFSSAVSATKQDAENSLDKNISLAIEKINKRNNR